MKKLWCALTGHRLFLVATEYVPSIHAEVVTKVVYSLRCNCGKHSMKDVWSYNPETGEFEFEEGR